MTVYILYSSVLTDSSIVSKTTKRQITMKILSKLLRQDVHRLVSPLQAVIQPQPQPSEVIVEGDPNHPHAFLMQPWDSERLGSSFMNPDDVETNTFAMATYRDLHRCSCGREMVSSTRSLI